MSENPPSEETALIQAAQRGDLAAFSVLVERHHGSIRACLAVRMNHALEAEDLAQETLIVAFRKLPEIDATRPLGPWLRGVALNLLANYRRKFRAIPVGASEELQGLLDAQMAVDFREADESSRMGALRDCLETLDGAARALIHERYTDGARLEDMARRLGRKTSALSMQLHRLRGLLAACIEKKTASMPA